MYVRCTDSQRSRQALVWTKFPHEQVSVSHLNDGLGCRAEQIRAGSATLRCDAPEMSGRGVFRARFTVRALTWDTRRQSRQRRSRRQQQQQQQREGRAWFSIGLCRAHQGRTSSAGAPRWPRHTMCNPERSLDHLAAADASPPPHSVATQRACASGMAALLPSD
jgi:hypothetical protein